MFQRLRVFLGATAGEFFFGGEKEFCPGSDVSTVSKEKGHIGIGWNWHVHHSDQF